jgi:hypothetical protein
VRRDYWLANYNAVKMMNPRLPFSLRDFHDEERDPYMIVKYGTAWWSCMRRGALQPARVRTSCVSSCVSPCETYVCACVRAQTSTAPR